MTGMEATILAFNKSFVHVNGARAALQHKKKKI